MVYAPHGRSGVYALQAAFGRIFAGLPPERRLKLAKRIFAALPDAHPFKRNTRLVDHKRGDAGFYDLLLHGRDTPFTITELLCALNAAGMEFAGTPQPMLYDPTSLAGDGAAELNPVETMQLAEDLRGTFKTHVIYACPKGQVIAPPLDKGDAVPHLRDMDAGALAEHVAKTGRITVDTAGEAFTFDIPPEAAALIAQVDGLRNLAAIGATGTAAWRAVEVALCGSGMMHYSRILS